jgi:hypothetical protein
MSFNILIEETWTKIEKMKQKKFCYVSQCDTKATVQQQHAGLQMKRT